jgi:branched-chain amino acid transport system permease protein
LLRRLAITSLVAVGAITALLLGAGERALAQEGDLPELVRGRLVSGEGEAVEGVTITVSAEGGDEVDQVETDEDGAWEVELPGPGAYVVTIDPETLPDGVELTDADRTSLTIRFREGQRRNALFALGERVGGSTSDIERFLTRAADGVRFGLIIAVAAVGLSLIYGVTGLTNFAHGELVTLGGLIAWYLTSAGGGPDWPLAAAAASAVVVGAGFGWVQETALFGPLRRRRSGNVSLIVVTIGMGLFLRNLYLILFGGQPRPYSGYAVQRVTEIGPIALQPKSYAVIGIGVTVLVGYGLVLQRTRLGTAVRAVADNKDLAASSGIDVRGVIRLTWVLGGALAALGGVLLGLSENVSFDMGFGLLLLMFAAVVLGGIGTAYGALVGGLLIGLATQVSTFWLESKFRIGVGLAVLIVAVLVRPQGLLGRRERIG